MQHQRVLTLPSTWLAEHAIPLRQVELPCPFLAQPVGLLSQKCGIFTWSVIFGVPASQEPAQVKFLPGGVRMGACNKMWVQNRTKQKNPSEIPGSFS